jgi:hypothetical protein
MTCKTIKTLFSWASVGCIAAAMSTSAFGQNTCNPDLDIAILPPGTTFAVGQDITISVLFGAGDISGGTSVTISQLSIYLDCVGGVNVCGPAGCTNEGTYISYNGDASIVHDLNCGGPHTVTSNNPGGGAGTNEIIFTFTPALVLGPNTQCSLTATVKVLDIGNDATPKVVTGRVSFPGLCNNKLDMFGCASYSYPITKPQIQVVKSVDDDDICEGDEVNYDYAVTNIGNANLTNVILEDDNGTPGNTADDFNPTFDPTSDVGSDNILSIGETWLYTHGPVSLTVDTTNIATVTGDYVNAAGTVTVTDDDDAVVTVNPPPSCAIDDTPGPCNVELCVVTDACGPFTVVWNGPGGFSATSECITLDASDPAGEYCVTVTDCNGCVSGGPGTSCCYNFVPPVTPTCSISVTDCPFPRTLTVTPANCPGCTFQWGQGTAGSCTPLPGETGNTFVANSPGTFCVILTSSDGCVGGCDLVVEECVTGGQGRTPGFWKQEHHFGHWPAPYCAHNDCPCGPATLFCDVFDCTTAGACQSAVNTAYSGKTLLQVLGQGGGGFFALGRHAVAALLNSAHNDLDYAFTTAEVIAMTNAAIDNCNPNPTKDQFAQNNELGGGSLGGQLFCDNLVAGFGSTWPDFNNDGVIDGADMSHLLDNWGPYTGPADLHKNNKINNKDVVIMYFLLGQYSH